MYLETNVRAVFIYELFPDRDKVPDKELVALVERTCPHDASVRDWYYALLDYGAHLKKVAPNPSRRSAQYKRQSKFEGSHRQKRAYLLRRILDGVLTTDELTADLAQAEEAAGRKVPSRDEVEEILQELQGEGFVLQQDDVWLCAE